MNNSPPSDNRQDDNAEFTQADIDAYQTKLRLREERQLIKVLESYGKDIPIESHEDLAFEIKKQNYLDHIPDTDIPEIIEEWRNGKPKQNDLDEAFIGIKTVCAADIIRREIEWLWPGRIALGKVTLIGGDPGLGKSLITAALAAHVTTGTHWPVDKSDCPIGGVIFLNAEDDPEDTLTPRLDAAGADSKRIHIIESCLYVNEEGETLERDVSLDVDLHHIDDVLEQNPDVSLLVIDPISAYLGTTDSYRNAEVRALLKPLSKIATKHKIAIVAITHLKKGKKNSIDSFIDSIGFLAAARAGYVVLKDKDDPRRRIIYPSKNNIGPDDSGFAYTLTDSGNGVYTVAWEGEHVKIDVNEAMSDEPEHERSDREEAAEWLDGVLSDGVHEVAELQKKAKAAGHQWHTVKRAKRNVGAIGKKGGYQGKWYWMLPKFLESFLKAQGESKGTDSPKEAKEYR